MSNVPTDLKMKLASLQDALLQRSPQLPTILQQIHTTLKQQPENVTLLAEDEIQTIVEGLKLQTQTHFAVATAKSRTSSASAKIKANVSDALGL